MRRTRIVLAAVAASLMLVPALPAGATTPSDVAFEVPTVLPDSGPGFGPFTATGPAVEAGIMCPSGDTVDLFGKASGFQAPTCINFQVVKTFTCDDGSGSFLVKLQVRINQNGDNFNWVILDGTGDYADLHGTGGGVGFFIPGDPNIVLDLYDGKVHVD